MNLKICCIKSLEEAELVLSLGATAIGLVGEMPSGPGVISLEEMATIRKRLTQPCDVFLLTSHQTFEKINHQITYVNPTHLQLVDYIQIDVIRDIKRKYKSLKMVQVLHVYDKSFHEKAELYEKYVDFFLLDSGNPNAKTKTLGGTGKTHDWKLSAQFVQTTQTPVFLAGGLTSENINKAIEMVKPFGIDLCSGVRTNDKLDPNKLNSFFKVIQANEK